MYSRPGRGITRLRTLHPESFLSRIFALLLSLGLLTACPQPAEPPAGDDSALPPTKPGELRVQLMELQPGSTRLSFAAPFPRGKVPDVAYLRLEIDGKSVDFDAVEVLAWWDGQGNREGLRTALIQTDTVDGAEARLSWGDLSGAAPGDAVIDPEDPAIAATLTEEAPLAERTIVESGGEVQLIETSTSTQTFDSSTVPRVLAFIEPDALYSARSFGDVPPVDGWSALGLGGLDAYGEGLSPYAHGAAFDLGYALNPAGVSDPTNPLVWENGRCSTFALAYSLVGDPDMLVAAHQSCAWYAEQLDGWAATLGLWTVNDPLSRVSFHGRELFVLTQLTGSRRSARLSTQVADLWLNDALITDYREGHLQDDYWMEQHIAVALEGLWYGYETNGDTAYLEAIDELVGAMHTHALGTPAQLAAMGVPFPPQNCLVHRASQAEEIDDPELPWCSPWMTAMLLDPLVQYRERTGDARVDELLLAFGRFLRDTGTSYAVEELTLCDSFMEPAICYEPPADGEDPRILVPVYASGIDADGQRRLSPIEGEFSHCADAAALSAAALEVLHREPELDAGPLGPFASEAQSFEALTHELAACAAWNLQHYHREKRNPGYWSSEALAEGLDDPAAFIARWKIGYPDYVNEPLRQVAWWYGVGLEQAPLMAASGVDWTEIDPGQLQNAECPETRESACP